MAPYPRRMDTGTKDLFYFYGFLQIEENMKKARKTVFPNIPNM